ncbi:MAG: hypothetical protein WCG48_03165 [Candidatus Berkelbacteria bacterium]
MNENLDQSKAKQNQDGNGNEKLPVALKWIDKTIVIIEKGG